MYMLEITYKQMFLFITLVWIAVRAFLAFKKRGIDWNREALLITVFLCLIFIARIVYFPFHLVNGHIAHLVFDTNRILPFWTNLQPFTFLSTFYNYWQLNIIGNILMFIPVGIVWPLCFKKLDNIWKTVFAGVGLSLFIELSQLPFYQRNTDIDDLILNTTGVLMGAVIFFLIKKRLNHSKHKDVCQTIIILENEAKGIFCIM